jgi:hypothetical protein
MVRGLVAVVTGDPEEMSLGEQLTDRVQSALSEVMYAHDKSMPVRWVLVVECMEEDGRTTMSMGQSHGLASWEIIGMAGYAHQMVQAAVIAKTLREESA